MKCEEGSVSDSEYQHEDGGWDLDANDVLDASDTLDGDPGDDPLDQGITEPEHYSTAFRYVLKGDEDDESLDELLAEEEPDAALDSDTESWDENATSAEIGRKERALGADRRSGRLVAEDEEVYDADAADPSLAFEDEPVALDVGVDGGAATAEEAAVHVIDDDADADDGDGNAPG
jgi:hypothetical protein